MISSYFQYRLNQQIFRPASKHRDSFSHLPDIVSVKKIGLILSILGLLGVIVWGTLFFTQNFMVAQTVRLTAETVTVPENNFTDSKTTLPKNLVDVKKFTVKISNSGGLRALNQCGEGFTDMNYETLKGKQLLAAHNDCGPGSKVLAMELGDIVVIENQGEYQVTDLMDSPKRSDITVVNSMKGNVILQSCYFHSKTLKFVGLTPVS